MVAGIISQPMKVTTSSYIHHEPQVRAQEDLDLINLHESAASFLGPEDVWGHPKVNEQNWTKQV